MRLAHDIARLLAYETADAVLVKPRLLLPLVGDLRNVHGLFGARESRRVRIVYRPHRFRDFPIHRALFEDGIMRCAQLIQVIQEAANILALDARAQGIHAHARALPQLLAANQHGGQSFPLAPLPVAQRAFEDGDLALKLQIGVALLDDGRNLLTFRLLFCQLLGQGVLIGRLS